MSGFDPKYFDYAASTPPFEEAKLKFIEISEQHFANPSSVHAKGKKAKSMLSDLKKEFCDLVNFPDGRLLLCSSATEANNTIIEGFAEKYPSQRILIAEDAHDSIWYATEKYADCTDILRINLSGQISIDELVRSLKTTTGLVCVNHVCNETGTIHDVEKIGAVCETHNIKLLIDGSQAMGHLPLDLNRINFDFYTFSAYKFGGMRGAGGILMRDDDFNPLLHGGKQEWNLRAGTENIAGLGAAISALNKSLGMQASEMKRLGEMGEKFIKRLRSSVPDVLVNTPENALPGFLSISIPGYKGNEMVTALSLSGFSVSTGSACHADQIEPSRIILSLGRNVVEATGTIRISMGYGNTDRTAEGLIEALIDYVQN